MAKSHVDKYLNADLFKELDLSGLATEERESLLESIGNVVQSRLILRLMQELSQEQKTKLEELLESRPNDDVALGKFLGEEVPHIERLVNEEIAGYKKELIERMSAK